MPNKDPEALQLVTKHYLFVRQPKRKNFKQCTLLLCLKQQIYNIRYLYSIVYIVSYMSSLKIIFFSHPASILFQSADAGIYFFLLFCRCPFVLVDNILYRMRQLSGFNHIILYLFTNCFFTAIIFYCTKHILYQSNNLRMTGKPFPSH